MSDVRNVVLWRESYRCAGDDANAPHPLTMSMDVESATIETIVEHIRESGYLGPSGPGNGWILRAYDQYGKELVRFTRRRKAPMYCIDKSRLLKDVVWPNATPALYLSNDG